MKYVITVLSVLLLIAGLGCYVLYEHNGTLKADNEKLTNDLNVAIDANKTNQDTITRLTASNDKFNQAINQLDDLKASIDANARDTTNKLNQLRKQYAILDSKLPDDHSIVCLFKPSSTGCHKDTDYHGNSTNSTNATRTTTGK